MKCPPPSASDPTAWAEYLSRFTVAADSPYGLPEPCRLWTRSKSGMGYGNLGYKGRTQKVHRLVYEVMVGPIPSAMLVCHRCDRPACCEPTHLFLGTSQDNATDCSQKGRIVSRGRRAVGEAVARAKLKDSNIIRIREMHKEGLSHRDIATWFGVSHRAIGDILTGKTWRHVTEGQAA